MKRIRRFIPLTILALTVLCVLTGIVSALKNRAIPTAPRSAGRLDTLDQARLGETFHLKQTLGARVWEGWGQMEIPVILWNRQYSYLVGVPSAPPGWEPVPEDTFDGQTYYRQQSADPENFAIQVDGIWAASIGTKWETDAFLMEAFRGMLPPLIEDVFPYWLLVQPSEVQITGVLHETFHVFQARTAPDRLEQAEHAHQNGKRYWEADEAMHDDWAQEIELLVQALETDSDREAGELARSFFERREQRRTSSSLDETLVSYERWLEWEEGLAKYVELASWKEGFTAQNYQPLASMTRDPDFKSYETFPQRWSQELAQMKRQATQDGEVRFYYTGMAQAMLLDRLAPGWKQEIFKQDTWLETLLAR